MSWQETIIPRIFAKNIRSILGQFCARRMVSRMDICLSDDRENLKDSISINRLTCSKIHDWMNELLVLGVLQFLAGCSVVCLQPERTGGTGGLLAGKGGETEALPNPQQDLGHCRAA